MFTIISNEKQDIHSDFNHIKHVPMDKDHAHTFHSGAVELLIGLYAFFPPGKNIFNNFKPRGTKEGFFLYLELMLLLSWVPKEAVNSSYHQQFSTFWIHKVKDALDNVHHSLPGLHPHHTPHPLQGASRGPSREKAGQDPIRKQVVPFLVVVKYFESVILVLYLGPGSARQKRGGFLLHSISVSVTEHRRRRRKC